MQLAQELKELHAAWPHREQQVEQLLALLQQRHAPDILVHGPPCTGKTSVVRAAAARRPHAYLRCTRSSKLRAVLSSILSQLQGGAAAGAGGGASAAGGAAGKRKRAQGYAAPGGSEATLIADLQAVCGADACQQGAPQQGQAERDQGAGRRGQRLVVLDDAHHLLMGDDASARPGDGAPVLRGLLQLREQAHLALSFVLVSGADAGAGALSCLGQCCALQVVVFPQYTPHQLRDLLSRSAPRGADPSLYSRFLESLLLASTTKVSLCLPDLRTAAAQLWPAYIRPLGAQAHDPRHQAAAAASEGRVGALFTAASSRAAALARTFEPGAAAAGIAAPAAGAGAGGGELLLQGLGGTGELELPLMSKFLLVAAFLASRNKPSVDKQLFENSTGARRRGGGRRRGAGGLHSQDRQAEAAKAAQLKGPHSFTLQRLLTIYRMLRRADPGSAAAGGGAAAPGGGSSAAAAAAAAIFGGRAGAAVGSASWAPLGDDVSPLDVDGASLLSSVAGLVGRRLLSGGRGGGDDALGAPRYQCEVPAAVVERVALELHVNLAAYLRYV
ncbi:MAG: origin recognition complex subunit 5 C-terminus-domain-containing protein [Monoraphidium minutum]|nr:MAG: origin recognition complex subunit 5 C-terminus-domain-containing protein [Monoraphidium minutum]